MHTLVFPITTYSYEGQTVNEADRKKNKLIHLKYGVEGELHEDPGPPER